ncbi:efflux RND transporter permease subunit [Verrucomicrobiota bacterium]
MSAERTIEQRPLIERLVEVCLNNRLIVVLFVVSVVLAGIAFAPFDWDIPFLPRDPVPVDAIPDIGENQQIVFTRWSGRSPQDVEDQVTYRLTAALLGMPGVKAVRGLSMFGFSTIYVIFSEDVDFYWSRARIQEKINSLPPGTLPAGARPTLGPDATALGQVFWYTLEGQDADGNPVGGWELDELRTVQDWYVKDALTAARPPGKSSQIAEVASIGGFVREYQVDVDPDAMRVHGVALRDVLSAVKSANTDVGARSIEVNRVEYVIRGVGFIKKIEDIENSVIKVSADNVPIFVRNVANVTMGPAPRRGALDKEGAEAVGGVVVVRFGENPLEAISSVKEKIAEISPGLPKKTLSDGTVSQVTIVPFYDRTELIHETLDTLNTALVDEILVTIVVVLVMLMHLGNSILISAVLPLAVLMCFIGMKAFGIDANIVALSGIAIAIGTMVDMGVVISENILRHYDQDESGSAISIISRATGEVGSAVLAAVATTVVGFLPVFMMTGAEGKLFRPLAFTKTFALVASLVVALVVLPVFSYFLYRRRRPDAPTTKARRWPLVAVLIVVMGVLAKHWMPLGPTRGFIVNAIFVCLIIGLPLFGIRVFLRHYRRMLGWCLAHKVAFLALPAALLVCGALIWQSLGKEFMPPLDEGSFLYMPSTSPHASIGEALDIIRIQDAAISRIPEVDSVVGKLGRVESALDPAPLGMIETIITYKPEYTVDEDGKRVRQWRDHVTGPDQIWDEIIKAAHMPGITKPEKLQPISTRLLMLQSGIRGSMAVKIKGPAQDTIEAAATRIEKLLRSGKVTGVDPSVVNIDRSTGNRKPYLEIVPDRTAIAQHGIRLQQVQDVIEAGIGGKPVTYTVEGRERYAVRVRYMRELRDSIESLERILVTAPDGTHIPIVQLADIQFTPGPQVVKTEDASLIGYVFFGKKKGYAEVNVVNNVDRYLRNQVDAGNLPMPAGTSYSFAGSYEHQIRAQKTLAWVLPLSLFIIFVILYLQFRSSSTSLLVFSGIAVAWAGGFVMIWLYGQPWFLNFSLFGIHFRELFQVNPINLSVAIWVGFLALFGIATDDGVVMATYLDQVFKDKRPTDRQAVREATILAAERRVRPCLMTTATTILALLPVLTSTGRGADIMVPMAIPTFGGMVIEFLTMFVVPVLYCAIQERKLS